MDLMKKGTIIRLVAAAILLIATVVFVIADNEAVFPSTLVGFFLVLTLIGAKRNAGKSAKYAIIIFSVLVIALNFLVTIFLPIAAASSDFSGYGVELTTDIGTTDTAEIANHFIEVTINDMHELCYTTAVLLLIYAVLLFIFRIRNKQKIAEA